MSKKLAIVTGATRGLGNAIAKALGEAGYELFITAKNQERLTQTTKAFDAKGFAVQSAVCDFSKAEDVAQLTTVLNKLPRVDALVNNTGVFKLDRFEETTSDELNRFFQINCIAAIQVTQAVFGQITEAKGHIFNIGSIVSEMPKSMAFTYSVSKNAMSAFTQIIREELRDKGAKVTEVIPGSINTTSWDGEGAPVDLFVQPEDISKMIIQCLQLSKNANFEKLIVRPLDERF